MNIIIHTIPHEAQRYETVGDWVFSDDKETLTITISNMNNWKFEFLVSYHEECEAMMCFNEGIKEEDVTAFDIQFEKDREAGLYGEEDEPGNHPDAPYFRQHQAATALERQMAVYLGVNWKEYEDAIYSL